MSETPKANGSQETNQQTLLVADEARVETTPPATLSEQDYDAIAAAVMETERGRWFLDEYARRNRHSDTQTVLTALERLEEKITEAAPKTASDDASVALLSHNVIDLAEAITQVKREVEELGGKDTQSDHFNTATGELEAIVEQTEKATGEILEAAEKVQEVLWVLREEGASETQCDIIESKIIDIYTACSFQDLTGQRSNKVVRLVSYVEKRVSTMMGILGLSPTTDTADQTDRDRAQADVPIAAHQEDDTRSDAHLLNGPAMEGEGNEQGDVDALFAATAADVDEEDFEGNLGADDESDPVSQAEREAADLVQGLAPDPSEDEAPSADVFTNDTVIEIADAEILLDPAEQAVAKASLAAADASEGDDEASDVFEVEALTFEGPDMADQIARSRARHEGQANPENDVLADLPDTFALDDPGSDMFDTAASETSTAADVAPQSDAAIDESKADGSSLELGQDIFDVELVDDGQSDPLELEDAQAIEEANLDNALAALADDVATADSPQEDETEWQDEAVQDEAAAEPPEHEGQPDDIQPDDVPYTDEERIALFS